VIIGQGPFNKDDSEYGLQIGGGNPYISAGKHRQNVKKGRKGETQFNRKTI
jgi:hypothetical protein